MTIVGKRKKSSICKSVKMAITDASDQRQTTKNKEVVKVVGGKETMRIERGKLYH